MKRSDSIQWRPAKGQGGRLDNDLCERILADPMFMITREEMDAIMKPENFTGRSGQQVEEFIDEYIKPILDENGNILTKPLR